MSEFLVEAVPFLVGTALGWMTFDGKVRPLSKSWRTISLSLILGTLQSWLAGELTSGWVTGTVAILFDIAAVWLSWVVVQLYLAWRVRAHAQ